MAERGKAEADEHPSPRVSHGTLPLSLGSQIRRSAEGVLCTVDVAAYYEERWQSGIAGICVGKKKNTVELQEIKGAMSLKTL